MVAGIDDLIDRGGAMLMWPLLKRVLHNEDQVTRDFWHANLATVNPNYLKGVARSLAAEEADRSGEVAAAGIRSLVMHGSREKRLWRPAAYADMARVLRADLVIVDQAGHNVYRDQPDVTAANLVGVLGSGTSVRRSWAGQGGPGERSAATRRGPRERGGGRGERGSAPDLPAADQAAAAGRPLPAARATARPGAVPPDQVPRGDRAASW